MHAKRHCRQYGITTFMGELSQVIENTAKKKTTLYIDVGLRKRVKQRSAEDDASFQRVVHEALELWLAQPKNAPVQEPSTPDEITLGAEVLRFLRAPRADKLIEEHYRSILRAVERSR